MRRMDRQWWLVGGILVLLVALIGAGWLVRDRFLPVEVGTAAPDFQATTLAGEPVSLDQLRGEVVLLNIWATWCAPCREEMPSMQRLYERLGPQGLRVVAVSIDAEQGSRDAGGRLGGDVEQFVRDYGIGFDVWRDPRGAIQRTYRTTGVPESFIIDRDGTIIKKVIGGIEWDAPGNVDLIRRLLES